MLRTWLLLSVVWGAGCSVVEKIKDPTDASAAVITIVAENAPLTVQTKRQFAAVVTNSLDTAVTWSVVESGGGTVGPSGEYQAPATPGTYTVKAVQTSNPAIAATTAVTVIAGADTAISAPSAATSGAGGLTAAVPVQAGATYAWTITGGTISAGADTNSVTFSAGDVLGTLVLSVTVTNAGGSASSAERNVAIVSSTTVSVTAPATVSTGTTGIQAIVPSVASAMYTWSVSGGSITAGQGSNVVTFTAGAVGTLQLSVTVTSASGILTGSQSVTVVARPDATISAPANAKLMSGLTASVPTQAGTTYNWTIANGTIDSGAATSAISFTPTALGTVTLTVSVQNAAHDPAGASAVVRILPSPDATIGAASTVVTTGDTFTLTATPQEGATYLWQRTAGACTFVGPTTDTSVQVLQSTDTCHVTVQVTNAVDTTTTPTAIAVVPAALLSPVITVPRTLPANTLAASASVAPAASSYAWQLSTGVAVSGATGPTFTFNAPSGATTSTVQVTVKNAAGKAFTASAQVQITDSADVNVSYTGPNVPACAPDVVLTRAPDFSMSHAGPGTPAFDNMSVASGYVIHIPVHVVCGSDTFDAAVTGPGTCTGGDCTFALTGGVNATFTAAWTRTNAHTPTISAIGTQGVVIGSNIAGVTVTVDDGVETAAGALTLGFSSTDAHVVATQDTASGGSRTLKITSTGSAATYATITVTVTDGGSPPASASTTFVVAVGDKFVTQATVLADAVADAASGQSVVFTVPSTTVSGEIALTRPVKIVGPGPAALTVARGGAGTFPLLHSESTGVFLSGLTIVGGGGAHSTGSAVVVDAAADIDVRDVFFENNGASPSDGGALANAGSAVVQRSSFVGNSAANGGAIANSGTLTLRNATLYGNSATGNGGALIDTGTATIEFVTVSHNTLSSANAGVGIVVSATTALKAVVLSGNGGLDIDGTPLTASYIVSQTPFTATPGPATVNATPGLEAPTGSLPYLLPATGSTDLVDAVLAADCATVTVDQRNLPRSGNCDIGAIERQPGDAP